MAKKPRPSRKHRTKAEITMGNGSLGDMQFWRQFAHQVAPKEKDQWKVGEIATALQEVCQLLGGHWPKISVLCDKNEKSDVSVTLSVSINRANTPPEVAVNIGYSEKYRDSLSAKVPDADQGELPLQTADEPESEPEQTTAKIE